MNLSVAQKSLQALALVALAAGLAIGAGSEENLAPRAAVSATAETHSAAGAAPEARTAALAAKLEKNLPATSGAQLRATPVPGIYEYSRGAELIYVTEDGRYAFAGELYELGPASTNLTQPRRREMRLAMLATEPTERTLLFAAAQPKYTVNVFTDVDCAYCRKLHSEIAEYNRLGISVRYLFWPRTGPETEAWHKAEQVWCSADRKGALTQAKLGRELKAGRCANSPVAQHFALGEKLGVRGTPYIFTPGGELLEGLVPPRQLLSLLIDESAPAGARAP